jgi:hypothetical protein
MKLTAAQFLSGMGEAISSCAIEGIYTNLYDSVIQASKDGILDKEEFNNAKLIVEGMGYKPSHTNCQHFPVIDFDHNYGVVITHRFSSYKRLLKAFPFGWDTVPVYYTATGDNVIICYPTDNFYQYLVISFAERKFYMKLFTTIGTTFFDTKRWQFVITVGELKTKLFELLKP